MSKAINDIKGRMSKLRALTGFEFCAITASLDNTSTEQQWIDAWNIDQSIIAGMINDMELECTDINIEDYE